MSGNAMDKVKEFNINETMKYLITGYWSFFVFYSIVGNMSHLTTKIGFESILVVFAFGALTYHAFRSTLFPIITAIGDFFFPNIRFKKSKKRNKYFLDRFCMLINWIKLNDELRIERWDEKFKPLNSNDYSLWLSSIIMQYLCGVFTLLITYYFYHDHGNKIATFGKHTYIITGWLLIISGFISQRFHERRLLKHWEKIEGSLA